MGPRRGLKIIFDLTGFKNLSGLYPKGKITLILLDQLVSKFHKESF
jgi:hypothetical protein